MKKKKDCDVIAYKEAWSGERGGRQRRDRYPEEEEEEEDAAGSVDSLSNKANHSAFFPV